MSDDVGEVSIDITGDATSFQTALLATKVIAERVGSSIGGALSGAIANESKIVNKTFTGLRKTAQGLVRIFTVLAPVLGGAINVAASAATALAGSLYQVGMAGGALVGILGSLAVAGATAFVAFRGMGKALQGDKKAFKDLAGPAQEVVKAMRGFEGAARGVRLAVQRRMFDDLGQDVKRLARTYFPILRTQLGFMAEELNKVIKVVAKWAETKKVSRDISTAMGGTVGIIEILGKSVKPILQGMLDLYIALIPSSQRLAGSVGGIATAFAKWASAGRKSGSIKEAMDKALDSASILFSVLKNLAGALHGILTAASGAGDGLFKSLDGALKKFNDWTNSVKGQSAISEWADMGADALKGVVDVVVALAPVFKELSKPEIFNALVKIFETMALTLADIMPYISPIIAAFGDLLTTLAPILGPLLAIAAVFQSFMFIIGIINSIVGALRLVTIAQALWTAAVWLFNLAIWSNPITWIIVAIVALVAAIIIAYQRFEWFRNFIQAVWTGIQTVIAAVISWFQTTLVPAFQAVWNGIVAVIQVVVNIVRVYIAIWLAIFFTAFNFLRSIVTGFINWITPYITAGFNAVRNVVTAVWGFIGPYITGALTAIRNGISAFIGGVMATWQRIREIVGIVTGAFGSVLSGIRERASLILGYITGFIANITKPFTDLAASAITWGREVVNGIWQGIQNGATWLKDAIWGWVKSVLPDVVQKALGISSPSKVAGYWGKMVAAGLAKGLTDNKAGVQKAAERLASAIDKAAERLKTLRDQSKEYAKGIKDSFIAIGDVSQLAAPEEGKQTFGNLIDGLKAAAAKAVAFKKVIDALRAAGLNDTALQQLLAAGPGSLDNAQAILAGGASGVAEVNALQAQIAAAGAAAGANAAKDFYGVGISAAEGLLKGLEKLQPKIIALAASMGKEVEKAVKKALGIKSPSKVMEGLGAQTVAGFVKGMSDSGGLVANASGTMSGLAIPSKATTTMGGSSTTTYRDINVTIAVDDLAKMNTVADFLDMLDKARVTSRKTARSGTVSD